MPGSNREHPCEPPGPPELPHVDDVVIEHRGKWVAIAGQHVEVGDRMVPSWFETGVRGDGGRPGYAVRFEVRHGEPMISRVTVETGTGELGVRARDLESVNLSEARRLLGFHSASVVVDASGNRVIEDLWGEDLARAAENFDQLVTRRRSITPEFLKEVAEVYRANVSGAPTQSVAVHFIVSLRQASNYVRYARKAGELPPTVRGKKRA